MVALLFIAGASPLSLNGQDGSFGSGVGGFFTGVVGGVFVGAGVISARSSIFGRPNYGFGDGLKIGLPPAVAAIVGATVLGALDSEKMSEVRENAVWGGLAGGVLGLGLGLLFDNERPLALTTVGIAAGILTGTLMGLTDDEEDDVVLVRRDRSLELLRIRIRL